MARPAPEPSQLPLFLVVFGLTIGGGAFVVASTETPEVISEAETSSLREIRTAFVAAATSDGQFRERLQPFLHKKSVDVSTETLMLRDHPDWRPADTPPASPEVPRKLSKKELTQLNKFVFLPVQPTHVLAFTTLRENGTETSRSVAPLYMTKDAGWSVVIGELRKSRLR